MIAVVIHELQAVRRKVAAALRGTEWSVSEATNARDGVRRAAQEQAPVVLCAFESPLVRASEIVPALRQRGGRHMIIALGEHGMDQTRAAMDLGVDDYLPVSASPECILRCVRVRYQRSRAFGADPEAGPAPGAEWIMGAIFRDKHFGLTHRESEVLAWIVQGKGNQDLSILLGISPRTVEKHVEAIYSKLGVETRSAAMLAVMERVGFFRSPVLMQ